MVNVAIVGFGEIGYGVAKVLSGNQDGIDKRADELIRLKRILDKRDLPNNPFGDLFVHDFSEIEQDPEISIVVETIGGQGAALEFTERALKAGKSVVTANKELVASHGQRLMALAREMGVSYLFEASVGGGIPILRPLSECMIANEIMEITGILNGTTNYILTRMTQAGLTLEQALEEAQSKGYAEHNPSADISGKDPCWKICILASIAFGRHVLPEKVPTEGIESITAEDIKWASAAGMRIKLLGHAKRMEDGRLCAYVAPHVVEGTHLLATVDDVFNAITVKGNATGDVMFYGRGAGQMPTASAVVADVIAAARKLERSAYRPWLPAEPGGMISPDEIPARWYVRLADGETLSGAQEIRRDGAAPGESAYLTDAMRKSELEQKLQSKKPLSILRVLD